MTAPTITLLIFLFLFFICNLLLETTDVPNEKIFMAKLGAVLMLGGFGSFFWLVWKIIARFIA